MRTRSFNWRRAALLACFSMLSACSDSPPAQPQGCNPTCSAGYTCVQSLCTALCNPTCAPGQTCAVVNGATQCVGAQGDGGVDDITDVPADNAQPPDVAADVTGSDTGADTVTPPPDAPPPGDGGADAPMDAYVRPPCGGVGQLCCGADPMVAGSTGSCAGNALCNRTTQRCEAFTPEANECTATASCPAGQVCALGDLCGMGTRSCLRCIPTPTMGALPAGSPCNGSMPCADGICANSRCTRTCVPGAVGDAACAMFDPQSVCAELTQSVSVDGGLGPVVTFGACIRGCRRDADCMDAAANRRCGLSMRRTDDVLLQTCRVPGGTLASGAACPLNPTNTRDPMMYCQSGQCFSVPSSMTTGYCSAFCMTDADCPMPGYACHDIPFFRPSGAMAPTQPIRMCERM